MGVIFNVQILSYRLFPYRHEESFGYTPKIELGQIFQLSIFILSGEKYHSQNHWKRNFRFFLCILVFFAFWESLNVTVCKRYGFFSVLAAVIRENSDNNGEGFAVHLSTWPSGTRGDWRVGRWLTVAISNTWKITYFSCVTAFLRAENLCIAHQSIW